jgi:hypothetical protein
MSDHQTLHRYARFARSLGKLIESLKRLQANPKSPAPGGTSAVGKKSPKSRLGDGCNEMQDQNYMAALSFVTTNLAITKTLFYLAPRPFPPTIHSASLVWNSAAKQEVASSPEMLGILLKATEEFQKAIKDVIDNKLMAGAAPGREAGNVKGNKPSRPEGRKKRAVSAAARKKTSGA